MTIVKVCGLRQVGHLAAAAEAGADLLGMVFLPAVRRYIPPAAARECARAFWAAWPPQDPPPAAGDAPELLPDGGIPALVGSFADQPVEHVNAVAELVGLDIVQLCGNEGPDYWAAMTHPIAKVVHVPAPASEGADARRAVVESVTEQLRAIGGAGHIALLDRQSAVQPGGLGEAFDWSIARELAEAGHRFILAGGLTPENVASAIDAVHPYGVDVSSGVETEGVKDLDKIRSFVTAARKGARV